jgi:hypothetical protein
VTLGRGWGLAVLWLGLAFGAHAQAGAPAAPSAETLAVARKVAARDDFLAMLRTAATKEAGEIEMGLGDLTPEQKTKVEAIAAAKVAGGMNRIADLLADAYAARFTPEELRGMDAFLESAAGQAYSQRLMALLPALTNLKGFDLKKDILTETCAEIGKGCPPAPKPTDTK